jgi:alcohol dehydrogenase YqhD (iron-dependent ADH family)
MKLIKERNPERIHDLGKALFETSDVDQVIYKLEHFFRVMESPVRLKDINISISDPQVRTRIKNALVLNKVTGNHYKLNEQDYEFLLDHMA